MKKWMFIVCLFSASFGFTSDLAWAKYEFDVLRHQKEVHGWCTTQKAKRLMDLIYETQAKVCVEVGVFGGSSIYPMASALKYLGTGTIYAIDSWENSDCLEELKEEKHIQAWASVDLEEIYQNFLEVLDHFQIAPYTHVMRMQSKRAAAFFEDETIDILHIDGNHSAEISMQDVRLFLPKLKKGGYLWFDDADWESTKGTVAFLKEHLRFDPSRSIGDSCLLFIK